MLTVRRAVVHCLFALPCSVAWAQEDPTAGFDVYTVDDQGGGWVVHRLPGRGDTLWGCTDVSRETDRCVQVFFEAWRTGTQLEVLHVSEGTDAMWLRLRAPGWGDTLLACYAPETRPQCTPVSMDLWPRRAALERVWPHYTREQDGGYAQGDPRRKVEPPARAEMWVEAGGAVPGPVNLYSCIGLAEGTPRCRLGLPNLLRIEREALGFRRLEDVRPDRAAPSSGARVARLDEGSAAWDAGLREGDVITGVGAFPARDARTVQELCKQYPAGTPIPIALVDGRTVELMPRPTDRVLATAAPGG